MQYLQNHQIDKSKWDALIEKAPGGIIYAYSWFLDIVSPGWDALVQGDYQSVMPLTWRKKFFIKYLTQPLATQQLGIFSEYPINEKMVDDFIKAIPVKFKVIDIHLNTLNKFKDNSFHVLQRKTHELDLSLQYKDLLSGFSENTKRNLKKSKQHDLYVINNGSPDEIINLFKNNKGIDLHLGNKKYELLQKLVKICLEKKHAEIITVKNKKGKVIAGAFFIKSNRKAIFLFSGRDEEAKEKGAMFRLIDSFIYEKAGQKLTLDFEGSDNPDLARFYKGFGSEERFYLQVKKSFLPFLKRF